MSDVVVVGSINMDLVAHTAQLPGPGETVLGSAFTTSPGGKGANGAIAAAKAGVEVSFIGAVGTDTFASQLTGTLAVAGVDHSRLRQVAGSSGVALISVDAGAENSIIVVPGANGQLTDLTDGDKAIITAASVLVMQLEIPLPTVTAAATCAHPAGTTVILNPSPVQNLPAELLAAVDILVVNEGEAAALGTATLDAVPIVVTTLGARGATFRSASQSLTVPAPAITAVDTTGAGDAFTGAFAAAWAREAAPIDVMRFACAAGALTATRMGASAAPIAADIQRLVQETYG